MLKIYPETKKVGTIYSSSEINSERQVQIFKDIAKAKNLEVKEATVSSVNDIRQQAAQSLVGKGRCNLYTDRQHDCFCSPGSIENY